MFDYGKFAFVCVALLQGLSASEAFLAPASLPTRGAGRISICEQGFACTQRSKFFPFMKGSGTLIRPEMVVEANPDPLDLAAADGLAAVVTKKAKLPSSETIYRGGYTSGTSAVHIEKAENSIVDDILGAVFQVGGKFLWPNDNAVLAIGALSDVVGAQRPLFMALHKYFQQFGGAYKLSFAPVPQATFYVLSDPDVVKSVLKDNPLCFDKGMLAEILEPILGKGLIPADLETWKARRPVIQPGFHARWLERMMLTFNDCAAELEKELAVAAKEGRGVDMEGAYNSVSLDIIGKAVFNYEFGSVSRESPVIKAAYACLKEAEHRSTFIIPYWKIPLFGQGAFSLIPRQRKFARHLQVLNDKLEEMIQLARTFRVEEDLEALEKRDYTSIKDPSLLRFLVDLRGGDCDDKQLRDDLMTLLVAGHETTGSLLTWTTFELAQNQEEMRKVQAEMDRVLNGRRPTLEDIKSLHYTRLVLAEGLRLYPQPPILLRRALRDVELPPGHKGQMHYTPEDPMQSKGISLSKDANIFISVWNLHRNPMLWTNPHTFDPSRWMRPQTPVAHPSWRGYAPRDQAGMYPNEVDANFGFMPFGGGQRKCVGDQFAMMEAVVILSTVLQNFDLELVGEPKDVGMSTGATIHTLHGLNMKLTPRQK